MKRLHGWIKYVLGLGVLAGIMAGCGPGMEARMKERATALPCGCLTAKDTLKQDTIR